MDFVWLKGEGRIEREMKTSSDVFDQNSERKKYVRHRIDENRKEINI